MTINKMLAISTKFNSVVSRLNYGQFIVFFIILIFALSFITGSIYNLLIEPSNSILESKISKLDIVTIILLSLVIAPLVETLIFQAFLLKIFTKHLPRISNLLVAILFALNHYTNPKQIMGTFFMCLLFNYAYNISKARNWSPVLTVFFIHSGYNLCITGLFLAYSYL